MTEEQRRSLIDGQTEAPYSGELLNNKADGTYHCGQCGAHLFNSDAKFDSGSGWPSFDQAVDGSIKKRRDFSHGMIRDEALCTKCGGHLGHVFPDGPADTTGVRYCVNSVSLDFKGEPEDAQ